MPTYLYKARDSFGKLVEGAMEAPAKEALVDRLHKMGYMTTQVTESASAARREPFLVRWRGVSQEDKLSFYVQLSNLISSGISLLTSLSILQHHLDNPRLKEAVEDVARNVEGGDSFSRALSRHPRLFPPIFVNLVEAGETSGKLDQVLTRYSEYTDTQAELTQKIKEALFYPALLLAAGLLVTLYVVTFVIPQFAEIFLKLGVRLPAPTLFLYAVGTTVQRFWHTLILAALALAVGVKIYSETTAGKLRIDRLKLKLPLVGSLLRLVAVSRFARTLSTLVESGVPILRSFEIVRKVAGNEHLARVIENIREAVERGEKISESMKVSAEFPPDVTQMVAVGEESGSVGEMLYKASVYYDRLIAYRVKKLTIALEPLLLVLMGGIVALIMLSMLAPIFDMVRHLRR